jgi:Domain of unknown function (DUF5615)
MRFLADECLDGRLVEGLRHAGHDVLAVAGEARAIALSSKARGGTGGHW